MSSETQPTGCLARVVWFLFGPMALLILAIAIAEKRQGWLGAASLLFLIMLVVTLLARWIDFRSGHATTADGQPATAADLRRFTITTALVGMGVWLVCNWIGQR